MIIKKFQSIVVPIFIIFAYGISGISTRKLTDWENKRRLNQCGSDGFPLPPYDEWSPSWLWASYNTLPNNKVLFTTAVQISKRHFLTSPANLLIEDWEHNGIGIDVDCTQKENLHVEVPPQIVKQINLKTLYCYRNPKCNEPSLTPIKAYLPYHCDKRVKQSAYTWFSPMILEIEEGAKHDGLCFVTKEYDIRKWQTAFSVLFYTEGVTRMGDVNITQISATVFGIKSLEDFGEFSGVIFSSPLIAGYASTNVIAPTPKDGNVQMFNRMSFYKEGICLLTGICEAKPWTPKPKPRPRPTLPPTTTTEPSTSTTKVATTTTVPSTVIRSTTTAEMPTTTVLATRLPTNLELTTKAPLASTKPGTTLGDPTPFIYEAPTTPRSLGMIEFTVGPSPLERTEFEDDYEEYEDFSKQSEMRGDEEEDNTFFEKEEKNGENKKTGIELVSILMMIFVMKFEF